MEHLDRWIHACLVFFGQCASRTTLEGPWSSLWGFSVSCNFCKRNMGYRPRCFEPNLTSMQFTSSKTLPISPIAQLSLMVPAKWNLDSNSSDDRLRASFRTKYRIIQEIIKSSLEVRTSITQAFTNKSRALILISHTIRPPSTAPESPVVTLPPNANSPQNKPRTSPLRIQVCHHHHTRHHHHRPTPRPRSHRNSSRKNQERCRILFLASIWDFDWVFEGVWSEGERVCCFFRLLHSCYHEQGASAGE